jgi:maltooligosyltrehalose trehalohydrolase
MRMPDAVARGWRPSLGSWIEGEMGAVRVWAPTATTVTLRAADSHSVFHSSQIPSGGLSPDGSTGVAPQDVVLAREEGGYFFGRAAWLRAGVRYWLVLDDTHVFPDPASRFQPDGVHGPSELIDPNAFVWHVDGWRGRSLDALAIYELHVGTFTPEGTFAAAADRLTSLAELGVTAVELMPIAAFPGRRNWGYDPAAQFAPADAYGHPDDLRRFVDRAHALGLGVFLDVVYNHFGPDGAYAAAFSPLFFSDRHQSPWGSGINLDGPSSEHVRAFFIENALHWLIEYRIDGLRLDATHALVDDSREHFLAELARVVRMTIVDREVLLIAEDNRNLRTLVEPPSSGGWGLDAAWADDFHHVTRRLTASDDESYFRDFAGTTSELVRTLRDGWLYRGEQSIHAEGPRGSDPTGLPLSSFVICLQNHDQVGNRAHGDRLHQEIDPAVYRALTVLLLLAPETPLLFMGQEWAASTPFLYFTDHAGDLGRQVREGRRQEFRHFRAFADVAMRDRIPDPQDPATFERSRLSWDERNRQPHSGVLTLYRQALAVRHTLEPAGRSGARNEDDIGAIDEHSIFMRRATRDGTELLVVARLSGAGQVRVRITAGGAKAPPAVALDTEAADVVADPQPARVTRDGDYVNLVFARPGALVLRVS